MLNYCLRKHVLAMLTEIPGAFSKYFGKKTQVTLCIWRTILHCNTRRLLKFSKTKGYTVSNLKPLYPPLQARVCTWGSTYFLLFPFSYSCTPFSATLCYCWPGALPALSKAFGHRNHSWYPRTCALEHRVKSVIYKFLKGLVYDILSQLFCKYINTSGILLSNRMK